MSGKRTILFFLFAVLLLSACNDHLKIEANNDPQGYADSQVTGSWKIISVVADVPYDWNGDGSTETNIYATWSACQKDNLYSFAPNKTGTFQLSCNATEPGTWEIINTKHLQYTTQASGTESERFTSMTSIEFKTVKDYTLSNGLPASVTKIWARQ